MPHFPMFVNLEGKRVVVVGGGKVASRKVEKLLPFEPRIRVIAPKITHYIHSLAKEGKIELLKRRVRLKDLRDAFMVIVAVDELRLQKKIYGFCVKMGIHCNAVDSPDFCTFLFPALVVRGNLVIGVSTSGKAPALSAGIRELIEKELPQNIEDLLSELEGLRESLPEGMERQGKLIALVRQRLGL